MAAEEQDKKPALKTSKWAGHDNYECPKCTFSSLDKKVAERHVKEEHA